MRIGSEFKVAVFVDGGLEFGQPVDVILFPLL